MKSGLAAIASFALTAAIFSQAFAQDRVVSVGGDITEIVYALGEGDRLSATDSTSVYPPEALTTPKVGYVRQLSAEGVLSLEPDLILISGAAGPPEALDQVRATGVPLIEMRTAYTVEAILEKTRRVADALNASEAGAALIADIETDWRDAQDTMSTLGIAPSVLFFSTVGDGSARAGGDETAAQGVIDLIGGVNVFGDRTGYKDLSLEAAIAADPDIILVMSHNVAQAGDLEKMMDHPAISLTSAAQSGHVFVVDSVQIMQFGPRLPAAISKLATEIEAALADGDGA